LIDASLKELLKGYPHEGVVGTIDLTMNRDLECDVPIVRVAMNANAEVGEFDK
jgi:hypothetical protein